MAAQLPPYIYYKVLYSSSREFISGTKGQIAPLTRRGAFALRLPTAVIHCYNLYTLSDLESDFQRYLFA